MPLGGAEVVLGNSKTGTQAVVKQKKEEPVGGREKWMCRTVDDTKTLPEPSAAGCVRKGRTGLLLGQAEVPCSHSGIYACTGNVHETSREDR
jgi:hypothetical protein